MHLVICNQANETHKDLLLLKGTLFGWGQGETGSSKKLRLTEFTL